MTANEMYQRQLDEQAKGLPSSGVTAVLGCLWLGLGPAIIILIIMLMMRMF